MRWDELRENRTGLSNSTAFCSCGPFWSPSPSIFDIWLCATSCVTVSCNKVLFDSAQRTFFFILFHVTFYFHFLFKTTFPIVLPYLILTDDCLWQYSSVFSLQRGWQFQGKLDTIEELMINCYIKEVWKKNTPHINGKKYFNVCVYLMEKYIDILSSKQSLPFQRIKDSVIFQAH